jgi:outer membrane protein TolC
MNAHRGKGVLSVRVGYRKVNLAVIRWVTVSTSRRHMPLFFGIILSITVLVGCVSPQKYREQADCVAQNIIMSKQQQALGRIEPFTVEPPADTLRRRLLIGQSLPYSTPASLGTKNLEPIPYWPQDNYLAPPAGLEAPPWLGKESMRITLLDALQVAALNSRDYQSEKENVYIAALDLDLECDQFRDTFTGVLEGAIRTDRGGTDPVTEARGSAIAGVSRRFTSGVEFAASIGLDLVKLLSQDRVSSRGVFADTTISIPLLRGSGRHIVAEDLTQAERNVIYSIYDFEEYKRTFAVGIATGYLNVLRQLDSVKNAEENYRGLVRSTWRARRLGDSGQLEPIQVDQSVQSELSARSGWIQARQQYERQLDNLKRLMGLPTDANIELDREELGRLISAVTTTILADTNFPIEEDIKIPAADAPVVLTEPGRGTPGPYEIKESEAIQLALANRLDLQVAKDRVYDSMRGVYVAADSLRAEATLLGTGSWGDRRGFGGAGLPNSNLDFYEGNYSALLNLDLPFERTAERNAYRTSLINLESSVRNVQELEDAVKQDIRDGLRVLLEARENLLIQSDAVRVAQRRVGSTEMMLEAGRVEIRDLLEARESLLSAQNSFTTAVVRYRVGELELQRGMGLLMVDSKGLFQEYSTN